MRPLKSIEISRIELLTENSVELTLIEPTATGLNKSIMDATGPVRSYLKEKEIHDYDGQRQGPAHKILVDAFLVDRFDVLPSTASLYRPVTKKGDPRIWFRSLPGYAKANDILAIIEHKKQLFVVNISTVDIEQILTSKIINPLQELVTEIRNNSNAIANELLGLLKNIAKRGPIPALLKADTAIGRTLETLLDISINSSKKPDYKGIELKSFREERTNRKTLFAQVPDWKNSKFKSSAEILQNFGYSRNTDYKLYCTVSTLGRNSQGLQLKIDNKINRLFENSEKVGIGDFIVWELEKLHRRLLEKHNETFWVAAESKIIDGKEHFLFKEVEHTKKPIVSQFDILLDQGIITLDHLIKRTANGKVVEKGPLFKIKPNALGLLFPPSKLYALTQL